MHQFSPVVITGGARGVTAEVAVSLARAGLSDLHLLGRTPSDDSPAGQAVAQTLHRVRAEGANATYHQVDVSDRTALAEALAAVRDADGPIRGVIHGAGFERSQPFSQTGWADYLSTIGSKLDGAMHLIALTSADPLALWMGFGSVAGRFGSAGQADYAAANEALARLASARSAERPECRSVCMTWPAWDEVGMAMRPETRLLLEEAGRRFLPVAEGIRHTDRELRVLDPEPEVVFYDRLELLRERGDLAATAPSREILDAARERPLIDLVTSAEAARIRTECVLDGHRDTFLLDHQIGPLPILPGVVSLELMAQTAMLQEPTRTLTSLGSVELVTSCKVPTDQRRLLECEATRGEGGADLVLRCDYHDGRGIPIDVGRVIARGRATFDEERTWAPVSGQSGDHATVPKQYPDAPHVDPRSTQIYHGPAFQGLQTVELGSGDRHRARIRHLPTEALRALGGPSRWWSPGPTIDACLQACSIIAGNKLSVRALPCAFETVAIRRHPAAGEVCLAHIELLGREGALIFFDIQLTDAHGQILLALERYTARTLSGEGE